MRNIPFLRRKLAHRLRACADNRRRACAGNPSGDDLKIISRLDRLACESEQLPQALIDEVAFRCGDPTFARRFDLVWNALPDLLSAPPMPASAGHLTRWMIDQARDESQPRPAGDHDPTETTWATLKRQTTMNKRGRPTPTPDPIAASILLDFTGGLAVVAPILAVWEGSKAFEQWRDRAFVASHAATSATVVSIKTGMGDHSIVPPATETLVFNLGARPQSCRVPIQIGHRPPDELGRVLSVVPRSGDCEAPLIPDMIGDPLTSVLVALAFLASGIASTKLFAWLLRSKRRQGHAATFPVAASRLHSSPGR